jgi:hypothetical protein
MRFHCFSTVESEGKSSLGALMKRVPMAGGGKQKLISLSVWGDAVDALESLVADVGVWNAANANRPQIN